MAAIITGAHRRVVYEPGFNNAWVQLHRFWVGYCFALYGTPPDRVVMNMDEYGTLTIKPDFSHEGEEVEEKRIEAMQQHKDGTSAELWPDNAEMWLRKRGLWYSDSTKPKRGHGRPSARHKVASKLSALKQS